MSSPPEHRLSKTAVAYEDSLGRTARVGSWQELAKGTFRTSTEYLAEGRHHDAAELVEVAVLEAEELHDIYQRWPEVTTSWILEKGARPNDLDTELTHLGQLLGEKAMRGIDAEWPDFIAAVSVAAQACRDRSGRAAVEVERARTTWQAMHDRAVDRVSGTVAIAVKLVGEDQLAQLWNHLMADWYDAHEKRYHLDNQSWSRSAHQLATAILDGFHAHLAGTGRQGDIVLIDEPERLGFRFAPCGSGGRSVDPAITDGQPRSAPPYGFPVTTRRHDWAWNTVGICSYCVHCCLLNEVMPIDRLGFPTRVIDAPVWTPDDHTTTCTWWIYKDVADIPDDVYRRVGRDPSVRPKHSRRTAADPGVLDPGT